MEVAELQVKVAEQIDGSPRGVQAIFIILDEKWGLKLFHNQRDRNEAFETQTKCFEHGWAPELGDKVDLPEGRSHRFGYITEILKVLPNVNNNNKDAFIEKYGMEAYYDAEDEREEWKDNYPWAVRDEWVAEIEELTGWYFGDAHCYNWGLKDDKWVPIDFG